LVIPVEQTGAENASTRIHLGVSGRRRCGGNALAIHTASQGRTC
jgi:hypothetical protein